VIWQVQRPRFDAHRTQRVCPLVQTASAGLTPQGTVGRRRSGRHTSAAAAAAAAATSKQQSYYVQGPGLQVDFTSSPMRADGPERADAVPWRAEQGLTHTMTMCEGRAGK
jgi:hypothetical protein